MNDHTTPAPSIVKLCECGCGQPAPISVYTNKNKGVRKGEPCRFVRGHFRRLTPEKQFWNHVAVAASDECWEWNGCRSKQGYGLVNVAYSGISAHRLSWTIHFGPIPDGIWVLHRCDNPPCCNPAHLFLGTCQDNVDDKIAKGRQKSVDGELNPRSKLANTDILTIRRLRAQGESLKALAEQFNVSMTTISRAALRKAWRHVP